MLRKGARLHHTLFSGRPLERRRFKFGSVSLFPAPRGAAAVIVSKKVARAAVTRNKIKRRVRHAFLSVRTSVPYAVAIYPSHEALTAPLSDITEALGVVCRSR